MSDDKPKKEMSLEDLIRQVGDAAMKEVIEKEKAWRRRAGNEPGDDKGRIWHLLNPANAATMPPRRDDLGRLEATLKDQHPLFHKARRLQATWGKTWPIISNPVVDQREELPLLPPVE